MNIWGKFVLNDSGVTAIEYAVIVAFIAIAAVGSVTAVGGQVNLIFQNLNTLWGG
jgi:pilus assembly protein Flp/PilA